MKFASLAEIRKELQHLPPKRLQELCLRMARHKKENKDLLAYLLFDDDNRHVFIEEVKTELTADFDTIAAQANLYYLKKHLRRMLRQLNRYIKFIDDKTTAVELLLWFCRQIQHRRLPLGKSAQLRNLFDQQVRKIEKLVGGIHEDLRADYLRELEELTVGAN